MFTIYIHILEVCAMNIEGASMTTIGNMGSCYSMPQIQRGVRDLEKEGFLLRVRVPDSRVYQITEKALEYCDTITRKREMAENDKMILEYAEGLEKAASNPAVGVIPGAYEELPLQMVVSGDYVFSVDGDGVPDHAYIGLANDDGSLPFDAIVTTSENVPSGGTKEGFFETLFKPLLLKEQGEALRPSDPIPGEPKEAYANPEDWRFDTCPDCNEMNELCHCYALCDGCGECFKDCGC